MMQTTTAAIRRREGIDDLVSSYSGKPEEEKPVATVGENPFPALLKEYEAFLGGWYEYTDIEQFVRKYIHDPSTLTNILSPDEINVFLQTTIQYDERGGYSDLTGIFISGLIQKSYTAGHNNFTLNTKVLPELYRLGADLKGKKGNPITICIEGGVGYLCGWRAKYCAFSIRGNVWDWCGSEANESTFSIQGDIRIGGGAPGAAATNCIFKAEKQETVEKLLQYVPEGNIIIYLKPDGTEKVHRK